MSKEDKEDRAFRAGYVTAWTRILNEAYQRIPTADRDKVALVTERAGAIAALRSLCKHFGDNDWPDELELSDIIEKHLARYLYSK